MSNQEEIGNSRSEFERYAILRGIKIERTPDSYKGQAAKSAWNAWQYQQHKIDAALQSQAEASNPLGYTAIFNAIAHAVKLEHGMNSISVERFEKSIGGEIYLHPQAEAVEQEPVAWQITNFVHPGRSKPYTMVTDSKATADAWPEVKPLYLNPPTPKVSNAKDGWKLVPIEPTDEMVSLARTAWDEATAINKPQVIKIIYKAMLAAAPLPEFWDWWQPIETAPKDGTKIIVWVSPHTPMIAAFNNGQWEKRAGSYMAHSPTHWKPLPEPPVQENT